MELSKTVTFKDMGGEMLRKKSI